MSNVKTQHINEEDLTSPSSDEKMDTGSESFRSQDTPNSAISSDFEDRDQNDQNVLRLQNPENYQQEDSLNLSFIDKMSKLYLNSPKNDKIKNIGVSPPRVNSALTLTTNHPLMALESPQENYPDVIPKMVKNDDQNLIFSKEFTSFDERINCTPYYSPERNTSKNNLFFSELFLTPSSHILEDDVQPGIACVENVKLGVNEALPKEGAIVNRIFSQSTPKAEYGRTNENDDLEYRCPVENWCETTPQLRKLPNFELPIEMSTNVALRNDLDSPDVISTSTQGDRSAYQALLDPFTGNVALCQKVPRQPPLQRRKIMLPPDDDSCSLDSDTSMESEEIPPQPGKTFEEYQSRSQEPQTFDEEYDKRSKSTNTISESSDIQEYSAAEELKNERAWITVPRDGRNVVCDMKVIDPFKRVLSHGGYDSRGVALIVFSACHLPDNARPDYTYVMDNLFLYVIWTLERLVTDEYILVYLHGCADRRRLPTFRWLHECYKLIDRRLRKSLQHLYLVHPTFWLKSLVVICKPFVSAKFSRKLSYVRSLAELMEKVPVEPNAIPEIVKDFDAARQ